MILKGYISDEASNKNDELYVRDCKCLAEVYYNLALLYKSNQKFQKAITNFQTAQRLYQDNIGSKSIHFYMCHFEIIKIKFI